MHLSALIFDMDGTLGDTIPSILVALRETFARFTGRIYTDEEISAMFGPSDEGIIEQRVPAEMYEAALQFFLQRYDELHTTEPFPGICELIARQKERGMRIAVATGKGSRSAAISMRAYGLDTYIDLLETGSKHGAVKPELIRRILDVWGIPASEAAYIGDAQSDMADARAVGVLPIGATWSQSATVTDADTPYRFTRVEELQGWLERA
jgi:pyrophosphatase PpaX